MLTAVISQHSMKQHAAVYSDNVSCQSVLAAPCHGEGVSLWQTCLGSCYSELIGFWMPAYPWVCLQPLGSVKMCGLILGWKTYGRTQDFLITRIRELLLWYQADDEVLKVWQRLFVFFNGTTGAGDTDNGSNMWRVRGKLTKLQLTANVNVAVLDHMKQANHSFDQLVICFDVKWQLTEATLSLRECFVHQATKLEYLNDLMWIVPAGACGGDWKVKPFTCKFQVGSKCHTKSGEWEVRPSKLETHVVSLA